MRRCSSMPAPLLWRRPRSLYGLLGRLTVGYDGVRGESRRVNRLKNVTNNTFCANECSDSHTIILDSQSKESRAWPELMVESGARSDTVPVLASPSVPPL